MFLSGQYYENKVRVVRVGPDEKKILTDTTCFKPESLSDLSKSLEGDVILHDAKIMRKIRTYRTIT